MNERIKDLVEHCDFYVGNEHYDKSPEEQHRLIMEKFAELIVRACADAADMAQEANCEYAGDYVTESLGFGEEEGVTMWRFKD